MSKFHPNIRNAVRAIIIRNGQLLMLRKGGDDTGDRYSLPGGAQETGESLHHALIRECQEEIDTAVEISGLVHVADYFKYRPQPYEHQRHQVEFFFLCQVPGHYQPRNGKQPDKHQLAVDWIALEHLSEVNLAPSFYAEILLNLSRPGNSVYAGVY